MPFSRDTRALVYQRAKMVLDKRPFGTQEDVYREGYEWMHHSVAPKPHAEEKFRISIGGPDCAQAIFGLGVQHLGDELRRAVAERGARAQCRREEGRLRPRHRRGRRQPLSPRDGRRHHLGDRLRLFRLPQPRRHLQSGRVRADRRRRPDQDGRAQDQPGRQARPRRRAAGGQGLRGDFGDPRRRHGRGLHLAGLSHGVLDADRDDAVHRQTCANCRAASRPASSCASAIPGSSWRSARRCWRPASIPTSSSIDGNEGGTGAAPLEFMDHLGMPMREGVSFVHNALVGIKARDRIRLGASGKIATAFDMARAMAIGADWCNSARGFMFALGCIQSLSCHTDRCPTGVTTQDPTRNRALFVPDKIDAGLQLPSLDPARAGRASGRGRPRTSAGAAADPFLAAELDHGSVLVRPALSGAAAGRVDRRHRRPPLSRRLGDGARGDVPAGAVMKSG